jgi:predicted helicase
MRTAPIASQSPAQSHRKMTFNHILDKYRKLSHSERDKGDRFERLMQGFLMTDPTYATQFKKVWLWNEFPGRKDLGGSDTGIDLVALTHAGDFWAIQCKCVAADSVVDKRAVDSFLGSLGNKPIFVNQDISDAA